MHYLVLACDYDGTIAKDGKVAPSTVSALEKVLASGRKLLLVTGREIPDLAENFADLDLFEWIVGENGGLLYSASRKEERLLAEPPSAQFVNELVRRGVGPMSVGKTIVATWRPHETTVLEVIQELGLELQVIFNKEAVMVLPSGVNKASGLSAALKALSLSPHNVVGVGDAENDHAFLKLCECSVAVGNAIPTLKENADLTTRATHGQGVEELIEQLLDDDLRRATRKVARHSVSFGKTADGGSELLLPTRDEVVLIAGPSGSGKSTSTTAILERLIDATYQVVIIDPEGDYQSVEQVVTIGGATQPPVLQECMEHITASPNTLAVNLVAMAINDRPAFATALLSELLALRRSIGRPHWIVLDEAHHLFPEQWMPATQLLPGEIDRLIMVTVHPAMISRALLDRVTAVVAVGKEPGAVFAEVAQTIGDQEVVPHPVDPGTVQVWTRANPSAGRPAGEVFAVEIAPSRSVRRRHVRKYAEGALPEEKCFLFTGPDGKLKLRAQNLMVFLQLAEGVDDETLLFHLRNGEVSTWFEEAIKDKELAALTAALEADQTVSADDARATLRRLVEERYTAPASPAFPIPGTAAEEGRADSGEAK